MRKNEVLGKALDSKPRGWWREKQGHFYHWGRREGKVHEQGYRQVGGSVVGRRAIPIYLPYCLYELRSAHKYQLSVSERVCVCGRYWRFEKREC